MEPYARLAQEGFNDVNEVGRKLAAARDMVGVFRGKFLVRANGDGESIRLLVRAIAVPLVCSKKPGNLLRGGVSDQCRDGREINLTMP
jgi:hypothetical protein